MSKTPSKADQTARLRQKAAAEAERRALLRKASEYAGRKITSAAEARAIIAGAEQNGDPTGGLLGASDLPVRETVGPTADDVPSLSITPEGVQQIAAITGEDVDEVVAAARRTGWAVDESPNAKARATRAANAIRQPVVPAVPNDPTALAVPFRVTCPKGERRYESRAVAEAAAKKAAEEQDGVAVVYLGSVEVARYRPGKPYKVVGPNGNLIGAYADEDKARSRADLCARQAKRSGQTGTCNVVFDGETVYAGNPDNGKPATQRTPGERKPRRQPTDETVLHGWRVRLELAGTDRYEQDVVIWEAVQAGASAAEICTLWTPTRPAVGDRVAELRRNDGPNTEHRGRKVAPARKG